MHHLRNVFRLLPWLLACMPALAAEPAWKLGFDGYGPLKVGMRFGQVNKLLGKRLVRTPPQLLATADCEQIPMDKDEMIWLMFTGEVLTRIDVMGGVATDRGITTGDAEARVRSAYPSATSQDADGGLYLTVLSPDGKRAMRFETYQGKVQMFYAGAFEQVQYIEGCS
jgi:hypothetical protein